MQRGAPHAQPGARVRARAPPPPHTPTHTHTTVQVRPIPAGAGGDAHPRVQWLLRSSVLIHLPLPPIVQVRPLPAGAGGDTRPLGAAEFALFTAESFAGPCPLRRCGPFPPALEAMKDPRVRRLLNSMVDAVLPLGRGLEALERAGQKGTLKVQLEVAPPSG